MKLEAGKKYKTREGDIVTIGDIHGDIRYPFLGSNGRMYTEGGYACEPWASPTDLIEEVKEEEFKFLGQDSALLWGRT